jgi:choline dehydrogenase-like flavoprotein
MAEHYDVIIVGTGAGGGTLARTLAPKAHELNNLSVVDTSFFPSIGAVGPALTALASAIRVGEHRNERLA